MDRGTPTPGLPELLFQTRKHPGPTPSSPPVSYQTMMLESQKQTHTKPCCHDFNEDKTLVNLTFSMKRILTHNLRERWMFNRTHLALRPSTSCFVRQVKRLGRQQGGPCITYPFSSALTRHRTQSSLPPPPGALGQFPCPAEPGPLSRACSVFLIHRLWELHKVGESPATRNLCPADLPRRNRNSNRDPKSCWPA